MRAYSLSEINQIVDGKLLEGKSSFDSLYISTDSRKILHPYLTLFIALPGKNSDGHKYLVDAYNKGVRSFLVQERPRKLIEDASYILVQDSLQALQKLAQYHRSQFQIPIIGITGSNGKTIVKEWLYQLLQSDFLVCRSPKSYNSQLGVPMSVMQLEQKHQIGIFEAGISTTNEMEHLAQIIQPTIGIFTNVGPAHNTGFKDYEQKVQEKMKLFATCEKLIINSDYELIEKAIPAHIQKISWGSRESDRYQILNKTLFQHQAIIELKTPERIFSLVLPFADSAYIENSMHCVAMMLELGFELEIIQAKMASLRLLPMRLELKYGLNNCTIIDDSYSADLLSLEAALEFFRQQESTKKRTLIISSFDQSGMSEQQLVDELVKIIRTNKFQKVITVGKLFLKHVNKFSKLKIEYHSFRDTESLLQQLEGIGFQDEAILIKGARQYQFEKVTYRLLGQSHQTILEIDLNALTDNFDVYRSYLKKETGIIPMVKAFSYGSGSTEIATILEAKRVSYFAVAYVDEGIQLRKGGIQTKILVMNASPNEFEKMVQYQLEPEIYDISMLQNLHLYLETINYSGHYPIHLKVETGMNRLGFQEQYIDQLITELNYQDLVKVATIFSHLAVSDEPTMDAFTHIQLEKFDKISNQIIEALDYPIQRHILNSSGIVRFPQYQYDFVRLGIGLYGIDSSQSAQSQLTTIGTLKTTISQIKEVTAEESIGYGRRGHLAEAGRIAIIAIGYADGFDRRFSNGVGLVYIKGQVAPVVGNICMDMCMVDVSHIPDASEGDEVEVYGKNISIIEAAERIETIPYELLTKISRRVRRVYFWN